MRLQNKAEAQRQRVMVNVEIHLAENREPAFMARTGTMRVIPAWDSPALAPMAAQRAPAGTSPQFIAPRPQYFVMPPQSGHAPGQPVRFVTVPYPPQPVQYLPPQCAAAGARPPPAPAGPVAPGYMPVMIPQGQLPGQPPYPISAPYAYPWAGQPSVVQPRAPPIVQQGMSPVAPAPIQARQPAQAFAPAGSPIDPDTPPILPETGAGGPPEGELGMDEADFIPQIVSRPP
jgi:hypothetical protein